MDFNTRGTDGTCQIPTDDILEIQGKMLKKWIKKLTC